MESLEFKPDVILLDIMMPGMDGFEVLGALRNNSSMDILIIIHSCLDKQSDIDHAFDLGADDYIVKSNRTPRSSCGASTRASSRKRKKWRNAK